MADIANQLVTELRDQEFSEGYAESFLDTYIATQIRVLRDERGMTQEQVAKKLGTSQTVISRIEGAGYSKWNIATLKKLARAFDVRLHISFETVGSLIDEVSGFSRKGLQRTKRSEDPRLYPVEARLKQKAIESQEPRAEWIAAVAGDRPNKVLIFVVKNSAGATSSAATNSRLDRQQESGSGDLIETGNGSDTDGDWGLTASIGGR